MNAITIVIVGVVFFLDGHTGTKLALQMIIIITVEDQLVSKNG